MANPIKHDFISYLCEHRRRAMKSAVIRLHSALRELLETYHHPEKGRQHTNLAFEEIVAVQNLLARWAP